ncbi:MAG: hypothetical protein AAGC67_22180, partial [Myxococcota bacterium]
MFKTFAVAEHERALLFRDGRFERVLGPGRHRVMSILPRKRIRVEKFDVTALVFAHPRADFLVNTYEDALANVFEIVETGDAEVAVVRADGAVHEIVAPASRRIYWRGARRLDDLVDCPIGADDRDFGVPGLDDLEDVRESVLVR